MKLEVDPRRTATVTLSKRNLLALLTKLEMAGSARTIVSYNTEPDGWVLVVRAESDEEHYSTRTFPPGPMHPHTELDIALLGMAA